MKLSKDVENRETKQTILLFVFLIIISLILGSLPAMSFGQNPPGLDLPPVSPSPMDVIAAPASLALDAPAPTVAPSVPAAPLVDFAPITASAPTALKMTTEIADQTPVLPMSLKTETAASQEPTAKQLQERPELLRSVAAPEHPFYNYYGLPSDPKSPIQGKAYTVGQLLNGIRDPAARRQLLVAYWELAGLLAESNIRLDAERRIQLWYTEADKARNAQRAEGFAGAFYIVQQQRKTAEIAFAQKQYQLVERLRTLHGARAASLAPKDYPIPCDYPIARNYVTYADTIARSERARHAGRMIPHQAELIEARKKGHLATEKFFTAVTQNPQTAPQDCISALTQRTDAFVGLITAVVDYNKTIAVYTSETVGANVSNYRLLGAVLELPKADSTSQSPQLASPPPKTLTQLDDRRPEIPATVAPIESAYSRPMEAAPLANPFDEINPQSALPIPLAEAAPTTPNPIQPASYTTQHQ